MSYKSGFLASLEELEDQVTSGLNSCPATLGWRWEVTTTTIEVTTSHGGILLICVTCWPLHTFEFVTPCVLQLLQFRKEESVTQRGLVYLHRVTELGLAELGLKPRVFLPGPLRICSLPNEHKYFYWWIRWFQRRSPVKLLYFSSQIKFIVTNECSALRQS